MKVKRCRVKTWRNRGASTIDPRKPKNQKVLAIASSALSRVSTKNVSFLYVRNHELSLKGLHASTILHDFQEAS